MEKSLIRLIKEKVPHIQVRTGENLAYYTTFKIGGKADIFLVPTTRESLAEIVQLLKKHSLKWRILGGGSSLLVSDEGISDPIIYLRNFNFLEIVETDEKTAKIRVGAGLKNRELLAFCAAHGFSGCEFLAGIPGTIGGGVFLNAGTNAGCMADIVQSIEALTPQGSYKQFDYNKTFSPSYRSSNIPEEFILISATIVLNKTEKKEVKRKIRAIMRRRLESQHIGKPSAGCVFKNPSPGVSAGFLIDKCGLKGFRIGGAKISKKHANWIINVGNASFRDVVDIIRKVKKDVKTRFGIELQEEINIWD